jgi:2-(1,2-epoxy-1,2-dihydrophenyl)acetyl-CoA isomerase
MNATPSYSTLDYAHADGVAKITLSRPEKLNSFTADMHAELKDALAKVATSENTRCLVLTGAGRGFCAGQDLSDLDMNALGDVVAEHYNPLIKSITTLNVPVIASVNGVAAGAGANLALACDIVLAAHSAKFIQSFNHVGLIPDAGGTWSLPRLVGLPRAMGLAMTGEAVDAQTAEQWGMIWRSVADDELADQTALLANQLANQATTGLAYTKQLLRQSFNHTLDEQLQLERDFQQAASQTADFKEGVDAFLNKRKPHFTGR